MPVDIHRYRQALEDVSGVAFGAASGDTHEFIVDGEQPVSVTFDSEADTARIISPVNHDAKRLPRAVLVRLLEFNFPNDAVAGGSLCLARGQSRLDLVNVFSLGAADPLTVAEVAIAQGRAALGVSHWIAGEETAQV
jgi:hypothetical protein